MSDSKTDSKKRNPDGSDSFDAVTAPDEILRVLRQAESEKAEVHCESAGKPIVELEIRSLHGMSIVLGIKRRSGQPVAMLDSVFPGGIAIGTKMEIVFSLVDGQYAVRDSVVDSSMTTFTISASQSLLRLQRRSDFRVAVRSSGLKFHCEVDGQPTILTVLDLSAGGMRVLWPNELGHIRVGVVMPGRLDLTGSKFDDETMRKSANVTATLIRDHGPDAPAKPELGNAVSFKFENLSQEDSRSIFFACLFIHRSHYGTR